MRCAPKVALPWGVVAVLIAVGCADTSSDRAPAQLSFAQTDEEAPYSFPEAFCGDPSDPDLNDPFCEEYAQVSSFYHGQVDAERPDLPAFVSSLLQNEDVLWSFGLGVQGQSTLWAQHYTWELTTEVNPGAQGSVFGYVRAASLCAEAESDSVVPTDLQIWYRVPGGEDELLLATPSRDPRRMYPVRWPDECGWSDQLKQGEEDPGTSRPTLPPPPSSYGESIYGLLQPRCAYDRPLGCENNEVVTSLVFASRDSLLRLIADEISDDPSMSADASIEIRVYGPGGLNEQYTASMSFSARYIERMPRTTAGTLFELNAIDLAWNGSTPRTGTFAYARLLVQTPTRMSSFYFYPDRSDEGLVLTVPFQHIL